MNPPDPLAAERRTAASDGERLRRIAVLAGAAGLAAWLAGCAQPRPPVPAPPSPARPVPVPPPPPPPPPPAPPPPPPPPPPAPPQQVRREGVVALPPAPPARSWDEFRRQAAQRMVQAQPGRSYTGKPPPMLLGIPVLEIELNGDGSVRNISVTRKPADERAQDTIELAIDAIRVAAPYGDVTRLPRPWRWTEVFLFDAQRRFKPRILDQ
jgi:hypothetical protein